MQKYVIYRRVSRESQKESGLGLDAQLRDITLYLSEYHQSKEDYQVMSEFIEVASGADNDRPVLKEAVVEARHCRATILVSSLDRLSRKVSLVATMLEDKAIDFKVATMPSADKFQLHIYAALAQQERDFISLRTKKALAAAKLRGVKLGGLRPKTAIRNEESKAEAKAFAETLNVELEHCSREGMSASQASRYLNSLGVKTRQGGDFHAATVIRLRNKLNLNNTVFEGS